MAATGQVVLVLGGTRSGKSAVAERLASAAAAASGLPVTFVATGPPPEAGDHDWRERVAAHRKRRPSAWSTEEVAQGGDLAVALRSVRGTALVDSLGSWTAGFEAFTVPVDPLCDVLSERAAMGFPTIVVSEEVGLAVHAPTDAGRRFTDALGELNQAVAARSARVVLIVAGRAVELGEVGT